MYISLNYWINIDWPYGVTVSTLDFESINPSSNLGRTSFLFFFPNIIPTLSYVIYISNYIFISIICTNYTFNINSKNNNSFCGLKYYTCGIINNIFNNNRIICFNYYE